MATAAPSRFRNGSKPAALPAGEKVNLVEASRAVETSGPGRLLVQLIAAGWSLNGRYYPEAVLKRDGPKIFRAGTHNFIDHMTEQEEYERPVGSVKMLASAQVEDARWDPKRKALVAEVRLFAPWREPITDMAEANAIGMSIRAQGYGAPGEAEGQQGIIISQLVYGDSVDYVTQPAAGGAILAVLESTAQRVAEARSIGGWLESRLHLALTQMADEMYGDGRLTRGERITLSQAIGDGLVAWTTRVEADAPQLFKRDLYDDPDESDQAGSVSEATAGDTDRVLSALIRSAYAAENTWTWTRDHDPDRQLVWFDIATEDGCATYQQAYTVDDDGALALAGERVEVVARTEYTPVSGDQANVAEATTSPAAEAAAAPPAPTRLPAGLPPAAITLKESVMGDKTGLTPEQVAGTAQPSGESTAAAAVAEAQLAIVTAERDQYRANAVALTEAQKAEAKAVAERDQAQAESRRIKANEAAGDAVTRLMAESGVPAAVVGLMTPRVQTAIRDRVPLQESGEVNTDALDAAIKSAIEAERTYAGALLEASGAGEVRGLGGGGDPDVIKEADFTAKMDAFYGRIGLPKDEAALAAKGR